MVEGRLERRTDYDEGMRFTTVSDGSLVSRLSSPFSLVNERFDSTLFAMTHGNLREELPTSHQRLK